MIVPWKDLPPELQCPEVRPYYEILYRRRGRLLIKRGFDIFASIVLLLLLAPVMFGIAIWIRTDSPGPVFFRQERVTAFGKRFRICKFRTMRTDAEQLGAKLTADQDPRITRVGKKIRDLRLDELPQLFNILKGDMSFTGTRPEVPEYVHQYAPEWRATLLLPAGVTSTASVLYRDEDETLRRYTDMGLSVDRAYVEHILPEKMEYNLKDIKHFTLLHDLVILVRTVIAVIR